MHTNHHHRQNAPLPKARAAQGREGLPVLLFELPAFEWRKQGRARLAVRLGAVERGSGGAENAGSFHEAPLAA